MTTLSELQATDRDDSEVKVVRSLNDELALNTLKAGCNENIKAVLLAGNVKSFSEGVSLALEAESNSPATGNQAQVCWMNGKRGAYRGKQFNNGHQNNSGGQRNHSGGRQNYNSRNSDGYSQNFGGQRNNSGGHHNHSGNSGGYRINSGGSRNNSGGNGYDSRTFHRSNQKGSKNGGEHRDGQVRVSMAEASIPAQSVSQ